MNRLQNTKNCAILSKQKAAGAKIKKQPIKCLLKSTTVVTDHCRRLHWLLQKEYGSWDAPIFLGLETKTVGAEVHGCVHPIVG